MIRSLARVLGGLLIAVALPGVPGAYLVRRNTAWRNYRVVEPGKLYRSGQLAPGPLDTVLREQGVRTVVSLRTLARPGDLVKEDAEERVCRARGIRYVRSIRPGGSRARTTVPAQANVDAFLAVVRDPSAGPILVHCFAGLHRTGIFCALYRISCDGWSADEAISEMYAIGYSQPDPAALAYLRAYPTDRDSRARGRRNHRGGWKRCLGICQEGGRARGH